MTDAFERLATALSGRYAIESELGSGGMATVYVAQDLRHHRRVAIKVLRPELTASLFAERFVREVEVTARLAHPHIIPLLDSGDAGGFLFYVMPLVEGESLRERLNRERRLPLEEAIGITREVADALASAHSRGVLHRDIKPENILLEEGHAVVADFGVARALSAAASEKLTQTGFAVGTPAYMSPEQAQGSDVLDGRSDIYSLACVLYEMLGGDPPFLGSTPDAVIARKVSQPVPSLRVVRDTVPEQLEAVVTRALARVPADRFASAVEFADALDATVDEAKRLVSAPLPTMRMRPRRWYLRPWLLVTVASAAVAALGLSWFVWPFLWNPQGSPRKYESSIAVLYFDDESPEELDIPFGEGLTDELISRLTRIRSLRVAPRLDVMRYREVPASSEQIARELGVDAILDGSVRIAGNALRVTVQLVDADQNFVLWSDTYQGALAEIFGMQDQISSRIVASLNLELSRRERRGVAREPTTDIEAYQQFLRGETYLTEWTRPAIDTAIRHFEAAIRRDEQFADAHAYLAFSHMVQVYFGYPTDAQALDRVSDAARRALAIDPNNEVALISMQGYSLLRFRQGDRLSPWQLRNMMVQFRRLVEINPESPLSQLGIAHYYMWLRRDSTRAKPSLRHALSRADAALDAEPSNQFMRGIAAEVSGILANVLYTEGNLEGAIELSERSLEYVSTVLRTYSQLARYYVRAGENDKAANTLRRALEVVRTPADSGQQYLFIGANHYRMKELVDAMRAFESGFRILDRVEHPVRDYTLLYWAILARRLGGSPDVEQLLEERASALESSFSDNMFLLYTGKLSEAELIDAATRDWQRCEAYYFAGAHALLEGRPDDARRYFEQSTATGVTTYLEYDFSRAELELLGRRYDR